MYVLVTLCIGDVNVLVMFVMYSKVRISSKLDNPSNSFFPQKYCQKKKEKSIFPLLLVFFFFSSLRDSGLGFLRGNRSCSLHNKISQ